ncbi:hypothetical protein FHT44_005123 [Mycolicibacterium sp. BK634]|uniref:hypothetical protein n=1 Tax=Mycolicibacterium sp. BK634 TaxID=2587099 RepID=UPI00161132F8|nr:hypothetical protein [Mycolicibacterium sp. BK634]MBB3752611.1 hypothetical protein [Mycolicibacterium sp. BK634]
MSSRLKVTIDGKVVMDGDTGSWQQRPPEFIATQLNNMSSSAPAPYIRALMLVIAESAMTQTSAEADITTSGKDWSLSVKYAIE